MINTGKNKTSINIMNYSEIKQLQGLIMIIDFEKKKLLIHYPGNLYLNISIFLTLVNQLNNG